jgi:hypothetical protein
MRDDKTGWEIVFDGTRRGLWGNEILPPRDSQPSTLWAGNRTVRKYTRTGRHRRRPDVTLVNLIED